MRERFRVAAMAMVVLAALAGCGGGGGGGNPSVPVPTYTVTDLGTVQNNGVGRRINDAGLAAGYAGENTGALLRAFVVRAGREAARDLPLPEGTNASVAYGLNNAGQVVGTAITTGGAAERAFVFDELTGALTLLPSLPEGQDRAEARAINSTGQMVVGGAFTGRVLSAPSIGGPTFAIFHPALWQNGVVRDLGTLGGQTGEHGYANDVNDAGQVVGTCGFRAFLFQNDKMTALGGEETSAEAINGRGDVAGSDRDQAAVWFAGSGERRLGKLNNNPTRAWDINDAGAVVGGASDDTLPGAFLYAGGRLTDLNRQIPANSGWTLNVAYGINNRGQIVGVGTANGVRRAFLLTPVVVAAE
jgi:probable HAF family extracellular repeat protein